MYAIRDSEKAVVEVVRAEKGVTPETPEGGSYCWAETLLGKPAGALVTARLVKSGKLDPTDKVQKAILVRSIATVLGEWPNAAEFKADAEKANARKSAAQSKFYQLINGVANSLANGERTNQKWSFVLNGFHRPFADRMEKYYLTATGQSEEPTDA